MSCLRGSWIEDRFTWSLRPSCALIACWLVVFLGWSNVGHTDVRLPGVFADHMVLQRNAQVPVWGWADPGERVSVRLGEQTATATANDDGKWMVRLEPLPAGGPLAMTVAGTNTITLKDVMIGEVWLCSGQSNMAMSVSRAMNFDNERAQADYPLIRMFKVVAHATPEQQLDCQGQWAVCSSDTVGNFSATAYFFGRKLHQELHVPIGLINSSWGGTDIAAWTSLAAQQAVKEIVPKLESYDDLIAKYDPEKANQAYQRALDNWKQRAERAKAAGRAAPRRPRPPVDPKLNQNRPANLFNGMIHPLIPYAIRGAIWYQGERNSRNVPDGKLYAKQLKTLIQDWRKRWGQGDFAFLTVQLPNYRAPQQQPVETTGWVMVREAEFKSLQLPNTGIAITTDIGEARDIHPKNKQDVGHRLALWALGTTYDKPITYSGPIFSSCQYRSARVAKEGKARPGTFVISFLHVADGLKTGDGQPLRGFAIAGKNRTFYEAKATIRDDGTVSLVSPRVPNPIAARYNWADNPSGNLVNSAGLPAAPFRTDSWNVTQSQ